MAAPTGNPNHSLYLSDSKTVASKSDAGEFERFAELTDKLLRVSKSDVDPRRSPKDAKPAS